MKSKAIYTLRFARSSFTSRTKVLDWAKTRQFDTEVLSETTKSFTLLMRSLSEFAKDSFFNVMIAPNVVAKVGYLKDMDKSVTKELKKGVAFCKVDLEKQLVYGLVYEPDKIDAQGDSASVSEIEKACHSFMSDYQQIGLMHKEITKDVEIVECYIAPQDLNIGAGKVVRKGSWLLVTHITAPEIWEKVKSGTYTGYSMSGWSQAEEVVKP